MEEWWFLKEGRGVVVKAATAGAAGRDVERLARRLAA
jgi:hypothetical protein